MQTSHRVLVIELIQLCAKVFLLKEEESGKEVRQNLSMLNAKLVSDFVQCAQVWVVCALNERIKNNRHFIELEHVVGHYGYELMNAVFKEE